MKHSLIKRFRAMARLAGIAPLPHGPDSGGKNGHAVFGFSGDSNDFLLYGKPFQIRSGELHPARIPRPYWQHRIRMAKAMGMNTIALYVMWNYHEARPGEFDFHIGNRDIEAFIRLCHDEGLWVLLRPGPYVCAEWDFGGLPPWLLATPDIRLRTDSKTDPRYMAAVARYIGALAARIAPLLAANGGPVLMIQIENEFGSYGSNRAYLDELCALWRSNGIDAPFYTEDGLDQLRQNRSNVPGGAIALSNGDAHQIRFAYETYRHVPVMAGEVYPGWLTHWGDAAMQGTAVDLSATLDAFMSEKLSFNLYVLHGGTSFGYYAGANVDPNTLDYQPDITSYDYSAPVTEQGAATPKFHLYRNIIGSWLPPDTPLPDIPAPLPTLPRPDDEALQPKRHASLWSNLPEPLPPDETIEPLPFEHYGQSYGFVLYRKRLDGYEGGRLTIDAVHDYATVFIDGRYAGGFSRTRVPQSYAQPLRVVQDTSLDLPPAAGSVMLEILVEGMGRVNYGPYLADRKGIIGSVRLHDRAGNPHVLTGWEVTLLPMDEGYVARLSREAPTTDKTVKAGWFYRATLNLDAIGDTYLDMRRWTKGLVWVNGHALGRYWRIGPQHRLFCPAPWLTLGENTVTIFDLHQSEPMPVTLERTLT